MFVPEYTATEFAGGGNGESKWEPEREMERKMEQKME